MADDPTNYIIGQASPTPFQGLAQGVQLGSAMNQNAFQQQQQGVQIQQQQLALAQAQRQQQALSVIANDPNATAQDYAHAMTMIPSAAEGLQKAWAVKNTAQQQAGLSDLLQMGAAIANGQPQVAADYRTRQADAIEAQAGGPTPQSQAFRLQAQMIQAHPEMAGGIIQAQVSAFPDGKQAADALNALTDLQKKKAVMPAEVSTAFSDADIKKAAATVATGTVPALTAAPTLANQKTAADTNLTNTTAGIDVAKLQRLPGAIDLPDSALSIINKSADDSTQARQNAAQYTDLANQIDTANPTALAGGTAEALKNFTGQQNYLSSLRQEYVRLRAGEVGKVLPPGSASDVDIANAMKGFPSETAQPATISSFLRGMAKLQTYAGQVADAKSEWVNNVGSLGIPRKDIQIGGTLVPAGTTFSEFAKQKLKPVGAVTPQPAAGATSLQRLMQTYGAPNTVPGVTAADTAGTD